MQFVRAQGENVTWPMYEEAILKRFGEVNEDPMAKLKNLRYKTTIKQYPIGLPPTIKMNVRMFRPRTLADAFSLSNFQETALALTKQRYTPLLHTPRNTYDNRNVTYPAKPTITTLALLNT
ncbi:hypothetical protein Tco_0461296 [Tanacetum coccineum]